MRRKWGWRQSLETVFWLTLLALFAYALYVQLYIVPVEPPQVVVNRSTDPRMRLTSLLALLGIPIIAALWSFKAVMAARMGAAWLGCACLLGVLIDLLRLDVTPGYAVYPLDFTLVPMAGFILLLWAAVTSGR